tara:strand:+ start:631 stop:834 length:204 start_codon:yes stop_codon:yes gene_type:complete
MGKKYKKEEEFLYNVIPSPEYNNIIKKRVVNSIVTHDNRKYNVVNKSNSKEKVSIVLFPDGTAKVLK